MRHYRPDVVVTYDEIGFYGHPDHIQAHRITMAAADLLAGDERPAKLYWITAPRSAFEELGELVRASGGDWDEPGPDDPPIGLPDEEIATWVDVRAFGEQKFAALAAHASQLDNAFFLELGQETFSKVFGIETFIRIHDTTGAPEKETDLFTGLR